MGMFFFMYYIIYGGNMMFEWDGMYLYVLVFKNEEAGLCGVYYFVFYGEGKFGIIVFEYSLEKRFDIGWVDNL